MQHIGDLGSLPMSHGSSEETPLVPHFVIVAPASIKVCIAISYDSVGVFSPNTVLCQSDIYSTIWAFHSLSSIYTIGTSFVFGTIGMWIINVPSQCFQPVV